MTAQPLHRPIEVLLVAEDAADVKAVKQTLAGPGCRPTGIIGATAALGLLSGRETVQPGARPDLVLLLPGQPDSVFPGLAAIKADPQHRLVPVVVLLPNSASPEVTQAYQRLANCCLRRPNDPAAFVELLREIEAFWLKLALLPSAD